MNKITYRLHKPSASSIFKPTKMATSRCGCQNSIWCPFELLKRESFITSNLVFGVSGKEPRRRKMTPNKGTTNRVILRLDSKEWDSNCEH